MTQDSDESACIAYLLRHGATDCNSANPPILQGRASDGPLSQLGQHQAECAARCLSTQPLAAVYSSPLKRAVETAERIARPHKLAVQLVPDIIEVNVGDWEHRSWLEIRDTERDAYEAFQADPATHGYRNGENLTQVLKRVLPALEQLFQTHRGQRIAVVAHNVVNRVFLAHAIDLPLRRARGLAQDNCGINLIQFRAGTPFVLTLNSIFHLEL